MSHILNVLPANGSGERILEDSPSCVTVESEEAIRLLVTIDTECDKGPKWRVRKPFSFSNILEGVPQRLQPVLNKHDIKPTYLLSPEVLNDEMCAKLFVELGKTVELGTHLHAEYIEPDADFSTDTTSAVQCDLPRDIEREKLRNLTELFRQQIGYQPTSFRAGRFGIGPHTLAILQELGSTVDSSVTPTRWWWIERGRGVNFLGAPSQPYYPSNSDFRQSGRLKIIEVPVTVRHPVFDKLPARFLRLINPLSRIQTIALNKLGIGENRCQWLRPTYSSAKQMLAVATETVQRTKSGPTVICMMFHSNEATAGTSPYFETGLQVEEFLGRISDFCGELRSRFNVTAVGLSDITA